MTEIIMDGIRLSCTEEEVRLNGKIMEMPKMEKKLLSFFAGHSGVVHSREQLLRQVWGYEVGGATRTVDTHIKNLRARLGKHGEHIVTVRGIGYRLDTQMGIQVKKRGLRSVQPDICTSTAS